MIFQSQHDTSNACLGLPLRQALSLCKQMGAHPHVLYTGERQEGEGLTARVVAVRGDTLVVSLFRDGDPRQIEDGNHE